MTPAADSMCQPLNRVFALTLTANYCVLVSHFDTINAKNLYAYFFEQSLGLEEKREC